MNTTHSHFALEAPLPLLSTNDDVWRSISDLADRLEAEKQAKERYQIEVDHLRAYSGERDR